MTAQHPHPQHHDTPTNPSDQPPHPGPQGPQGDVPGQSPPRQDEHGKTEEVHSPSQTPAERQQPGKAPEESRQSAAQYWQETYAPPKATKDDETAQREQGAKIRERREQAAKDAGHDKVESTQGAVAPEPKGAKDHKPGAFEQPARAEYP